MTDIVLVGASGHARLLIDVVEKEGKYRIVGLLDRNVPRGNQCYGYEVLGVESDLAPLLARGVSGALVAIGDNYTRGRVVEALAQVAPTLRYVSTVHPSAQVARGVRLGEGSVVMASAILNANAAVGRHCFISTKASLDHDSTMEDFASLGPNATTGGNVRIGEYSAIAISATVKHGVRVGAHSVVGAGAVALHDIPDGVVAYGTPARVIRRREPGDKYL